MLQHEHFVNSVVGEAELVEGFQGVTKGLVSLSLNALQVNLLGRLCLDADSALHQDAGLEGGLLSHNLVGLGCLLVDRVGLSHLLVRGFNNEVLGHHLGHTNKFVGGARQDTVQICIHLILFQVRHGLDNNDEDVELVAKLDPAGLKAEMGTVLTHQLGSLALDRKFESGASGNLLLELDNASREVVARGLDELGASGPGDLAIVAHPPGFAEDRARLDLGLVWEAFFHEAG